jgi:hypothetical protein
MNIRIENLASKGRTIFLVFFDFRGFLVFANGGSAREFSPGAQRRRLQDLGSPVAVALAQSPRESGGGCRRKTE